MWGLTINWVTSGSTNWPIPPSGHHGANVCPSAPWSPHDGAKWPQVRGSSCTCTGHYLHWTGFMGHQGLPLTQHTAHNGETDGSIILCQCNSRGWVGLYVRWKMEKFQFILCGVTALGSARGPDSRSWEMFGNVNNKAAAPPASPNNNYPATAPHCSEHQQSLPAPASSNCAA